MTWDHERVEELLAAHALGGLDPEDAALAERALVEHVPECERCRASMEGFRTVAGELALLQSPAAPPETLGARVQQLIHPAPVRPRRWLGWTAAAGAAALVAGLSVWNVFLEGRIGEAETQQAWTVDAISALSDPEAGVSSFSGAEPARLALVYVPGEEGMYLMASGMRSPERGRYHVWLVRNGLVESAGSFVPDGGTVMLPVEGPAGVDRVMVTHEPTDTPTPTASPVGTATVITD